MHYYPDPENPKSQYTMFDDDGITPYTIEKNEYELLEFSANVFDDSIMIHLDKRGAGSPALPDIRLMEFVVHNIQFQSNKVSVNAVDLEGTLNWLKYKYSTESLWFDEELSTLYFKSYWDGTATEIKVFHDDTYEEDHNDDNIIEVFPNPFTDDINFIFQSEKLTDARIVIFDLNGKIVYKNILDALHRSKVLVWPGTDNEGLELAKGAYIVKISSKDKNYYRNIIKK